ncbi:hypothetical protein EI555_019702, partial [Monodon monoceros]
EHQVNMMSFLALWIIKLQFSNLQVTTFHLKTLQMVSAMQSNMLQVGTVQSNTLQEGMLQVGTLQVNTLPVNSRRVKRLLVNGLQVNSLQASRLQAQFQADLKFSGPVLNCHTCSYMNDQGKCLQGEGVCSTQNSQQCMLKKIFEGGKLQFIVQGCENMCPSMNHLSHGTRMQVICCRNQSFCNKV